MVVQEDIIMNVILKDATGNVIKTIDRSVKDLGKSLKTTEVTYKKGKIAQTKITTTGKKMQNAFKGVRLEFLGVMFGGQQLARTFGNLLNPIRDATGLQEYWNAILMENTVDAIDPMLETMEAGEGIFKKMNDALGGNLGTMFLLGETIGNTLGTLGQLILFGNSIAASFGAIPGPIGAAAQAIGKLTGWQGAGGAFTMTPLMGSMDATALTIGNRTITWGQLFAGGIVAGKLIDATLDLKAAFKTETLVDDFDAAIRTATAATGFYYIAKGKWGYGLMISLIWDIIKISAQIGEFVGHLTEEFGRQLLDKWRSHPLLKYLTAPLVGGLGMIGGAAREAKGTKGALAETWEGFKNWIGWKQAGGIVTRPSIAGVGEAGPEAIIPLNRAGMMFGDTNVYVNISGGINSSLDVDSVANTIATRVREDLRSSIGM